MTKTCLALFLMSYAVAVMAGTYRQAESKMGSPFVITVVHRDIDTARRAISAAWVEIDRLEAMISSWRDSSETSAVNRAAGKSPVTVSPELFNLVRRSLKISRLTQGAFDITFASAGRFWNYRSGKLPAPSEVAKAAEIIDYANVELDQDNSTIFLSKPGVRMGFAQLAKDTRPIGPFLS